MLIAAFKGTDTKEDWHTNMTANQENDVRHKGKFHRGFLKRANSVSIEDIIFSAEYYQANKVITCGHSLGGSVSTIVHMHLLQKGSEQVEKNNFINITFGAPFVGNKALEKYANESELSRNMFHFAAVNDVVPCHLSFGHTFRIVNEATERKLSSVTGGASEVLKQQLMGFVDTKKNAVSLCSKAIEAYFGTDIAHKSTESTLQNEYKESNYVPIGKTVLLIPGKTAEMLDQGAKIKERILQSAWEHQAKKMSMKEIMNGHSIMNYQNMVANEIKSFKNFSCQRILTNKVPLEHKFRSDQFEFKSPCSFICASDECKAVRSVPLYKQSSSKVVFCSTCQENPYNEEYFYHEACIGRCQSERHLLRTLPNANAQMFEASHKKGAFNDCDKTSINVANFKDFLPASGPELTLHAGFKLAERATAWEETVKSNLRSSAEEVEAGISSLSQGIAGKANMGESQTSYRLKLKGKLSYLVQNIGHAPEALGGLAGTWAGAMIGATAGFFVEGPVCAAWGLFIGAFVGGLVGSLLCGDETVED